MESSYVFCVIAHGAFPNGTAHRVFGYLATHEQVAGLLILPMLGSTYRLSESRWSNGLARQYQNYEKVRLTKGREARDLILNFIKIHRFLEDATRIRRHGGAKMILLACDPLAYSLASLIGRRRFKQKVIYFVDFEPRRFTRSLLGAIYGFLTRRAIRSADRVWTISSGVHSKLQALTGYHHKRVEIVPNIPLRGLLAPASARLDRVVFMGNISAIQGTCLLPDIIRHVQEFRPGQEISWDILGSGPLLQWLKEETRGLTHISFHGQVTDPQAVLTHLSKAKVGLALYDLTEDSHASYGDSLKIRDYLASGLHTLTTFPFVHPMVTRVSYEAKQIAHAITHALDLYPETYNHAESGIDEMCQPLQNAVDNL